MDAITLQGLWPNFADAGGSPPAPVVTRRRGLANFTWKATLDSWRKQREEEEEAERERIRKELEKIVGPDQAMEYLERQMRFRAAREEAETEEVCLVAALTGDDDE
jgi:hypothetical protein